MSPGEEIDIERLDVASGEKVELDHVLLVADGDKVTAGNPLVDGAMVIATAKGEGKGKKVIVLKYKAKVRYHKKTGHRQMYTRLAIDQIVAPGITEEKETKPARKRTTRVAKKEAEVKEDGA